jgi:ATP-dependent RNA helicase
MDILLDLFGRLDINRAVIFCNTDKKALELAGKMKEHDFGLHVLKRDADPVSRNLIYKDLCNGDARVLITAEEIRNRIFEHVGLVINYDFPLKIETFLSRSKVPGRITRTGTVINFVTTPLDIILMKEFEKNLNIKIEEMPEDLEEIN